MTEALLGLGGNIGDARNAINRAIALFCNGQDIRLVARSSDYRTPPWGVLEQGPFINACIAVETSLSPHHLLDRMQQTEQALGRDRAGERRWGPRTIDIDLLAYDDVTINSPRLTLPHPRMFARPFVLVPLAEIASERIIAGQRVRDALARVDPVGIERLAPCAKPGTNSSDHD
jgi:2-amino-4-hydroxy-6-hydroxymethyldihydropteridine diphosphokinase